MVDAIYSMPIDIAVTLERKLKEYAQAKYIYASSLLPKKLGNIISKFSKGGHTKEAINLAKIILPVLRDQTEHHDNLNYNKPQPRLKIQLWQYQEILGENIPDLVDFAGFEAFNLLCNFLNNAILFSMRDNTYKGADDHSYIWRPAIEEHEQNRYEDIQGVLVTAIREAAEQIARKDLNSIEDLISNLEQKRWVVFRRISLHLLRVFSDQVPGLVSEQLIDNNLFNDVNCRHEYARLLGECFSKLDQEHQRIILNWVEDGPDLNLYKEIREQRDGNFPTSQELNHYKKLWQRSRLAWFEDSLPEKWKTQYKEFVADFGDPKYPTLSFWSSSYRCGPKSPVDKDEIKKMSMDDLIGYLINWLPLREDTDITPEGFGRVLENIIRENPSEYALKAAEFQRVDPTYVRFLLSGLQGAVREKRTFNWDTVLELCKWVISQPIEIAGREKSPHLDYDPDWNWTRKAIASILEEGLKEGPCSLPISLRQTVWGVLEPLTDDSDPTPEYKTMCISTIMNPMNISVNTTRGQALHSVIEYALWIRRSYETSPDYDKLAARGFDDMPEVRKVLEEHLNTSKDPALAVRAVYGRHFPWIQLLDPTWAKEHVAAIFPGGNSSRALWDAAWDTYISFCGPYDNVFKILEDQYSLAIDRMEEPSDEPSPRSSPEQRLGEHLMVFYWRGIIGFSEQSGIFLKFWQNAPARVRANAIAFIGESGQQTDGVAPPEVIKRLTELWERRLEEAKNAKNPDDYIDEIANFGSWFISGKYNEKWSLRQLIEALQFSGKIEPDHYVVERLAEISDRNPECTVKCFELIIKGDIEGWSIYGWRNQARAILARAMNEGGISQQTAENIINYLGSRSHYDFRDLLK